MKACQFKGPGLVHAHTLTWLTAVLKWKLATHLHTSVENKTEMSSAMFVQLQLIVHDWHAPLAASCCRRSPRPLVPSVLVLWWQVKVSAVKKSHTTWTDMNKLAAGSPDRAVSRRTFWLVAAGTAQVCFTTLATALWKDSSSGTAGVAFLTSSKISLQFQLSRKHTHFVYISK